MNKPPKIAQWILSITNRKRNRDNVLGDFAEFYNDIFEPRGKKEADEWYWKQAFKSVPKIINTSTYWGVDMFKNHMKIAIRNIQRQKLFSFINIFGLAIGIATCMVIFLWVQNEVSYDSFHSNVDRIYRIERELFRDEVFARWPIVSAKYKQALIDDYPEIIDATRVWGREVSLKDKKNQVHRQSLYVTDKSIFKIFDFSLMRGNEATALAEPKSIVLTEDLANKYFGSTDVLGETLSFEWGNEYADFTVTGILKDVPKNSHLLFDMLLSFSTYNEEDFNSWRSNYLYTYVLTAEGIAGEELEPKLKTFIEQHLEPYYGDIMIQGVGIHDVLKMHLFPIRDIHLNPSENWELEPGGNITSVYIFFSIGLLILIIAGINFTNLSTARATKRAKEVSLRKTVGAGKRQLKVQFIQESILLSLFASIISIVLLLILIDYYNSVFNESLSIKSLFEAGNLMMFVIISIAIGFAAGIYPAFYLTSFEPAIVLKGGQFQPKKKSVFRRNMVVVQFTISIALIVGVSVMYQQMEFLQTKSIGFEKENVVIVPVRGSKVVDGFESFKNELLSSNQVISVAASADIPGDRIFSNGNLHRRGESEMLASCEFFACDYEFINTYKIPVLTGRNFSKEFSTDTSGTLMLNEVGAKRFGYTAEEAVGKTFYIGQPSTPRKVVGVVKDFNFKTLRREIEPLAIMLHPNYITSISIRLAPSDILKTINQIKSEWLNAFPGEQFSYSFLDQRIMQLYENDKKTESVLMIFSSLSILIACLGLFGLAAFTAEEKTKEIGIRKSVGASIPNIFFLLSKVFFKWVIVSTAIAWPIAWFLMDGWLQNFAYRIDLGISVFIFSMLVAFLLTLITIAYQTIKAAFINPVDALKCE